MLDFAAFVVEYSCSRAVRHHPVVGASGLMNAGYRYLSKVIQPSDTPVKIPELYRTGQENWI
jgi:hypothetical protein